jgi:hypothetical protein
MYGAFDVGIGKQYGLLASNTGRFIPQKGSKESWMSAGDPSDRQQEGGHDGKSDKGGASDHCWIPFIG